MLLYTSLPPKFSRRDRSGKEIGDKYLQACVASWKENGFEPISINRPDEIEAIAELGLTGTIPATMNEAFFPDRYGPPLADLFDAFPEDEQIAYVNADVFMLRGNLAEFLQGKYDDVLTMARRSDVDFLGASSCKTFELGLDFFCFNPSRVRGVMADPNIRRFQVGAPWWDYVFPLACMKSVPAHTLQEPIIVHQLHPDRWAPLIWNELGIHAGRALAEYFPEPFRYVLDHMSEYKSPTQIFAAVSQVRLFDESNVLHVPLQSCRYFPTIPTTVVTPTKVPTTVTIEIERGSPALEASENSELINDTKLVVLGSPIVGGSAALQANPDNHRHFPKLPKRRSWPRRATHAVRDSLRVFRRMTGLP